MTGILKDVRYALRTLLRNPGFALVAILTLALGIGANATLFSVVNAILLRPPAHVAAPERLAYLFTSDFSGPAFGASSYPDLLAFREEARVLAAVAAYAPTTLRIARGEQAEEAMAEQVSDGFFRTLGVRMALGRDIVTDDAAPGSPGVAVISYDLWQRRFGGQADVLGETLEVEGQPLPIVGVAPRGFRGAFAGVASDLWVPVTARQPIGRGDQVDERSSRGMFVIGRLRDGVSLEQAQAHLTTLAAGLHEAYPEHWTDITGAGRRLTLIPEAAGRVPPMFQGPVYGFLVLLAAVAVIVLLICCANLAGLLLTRAAGRGRELGVRAALGATRRRLLRQMLVESLLVSALGTAAALVLTIWATGLLRGIRLPEPFRLGLDLRPDLRVFAFMAALAVATALLVGLLPALRATRGDLVQAMKGGTHRTSRRGRQYSVGGGLVVAQVAMSVLLAVGAMLFLRTLQRAWDSDPGFRTENLLLIPIEPAPGDEPADPSGTLLGLRDALEGLPGVEEVSWTNYVPLGLGGVGRRGVTAQGYQPAAGEDLEFAFGVVGPDYFETIGVELVAGRGFGDSDRGGAPGVAVVNESLARYFWGDENPLGRFVSVSGDGGWLEVVGVARDGRYTSLGEAPRPVLYTAALQEWWGATLVVSTLVPPDGLASPARRIVARAAPGWIMGTPRTMQQQIRTSLLPQRVAGWVFSTFGALAALLASVGLYGVIAYSAARRTREIGIRVALGASRSDVLRLVGRQGIRMVGAGVVIGLAAALLLSRLLRAFLLGTAGSEVLTFAVAPALLAVVALAAIYLPARRATRVDPVVALREE